MIARELFRLSLDGPMRLIQVNQTHSSLTAPMLVSSSPSPMFSVLVFRLFLCHGSSASAWQLHHHRMPIMRTKEHGAWHNGLRHLFFLGKAITQLLSVNLWQVSLKLNTGLPRRLTE